MFWLTLKWILVQTIYQRFRNAASFKVIHRLSRTMFIVLDGFSNASSKVLCCLRLKSNHLKASRLWSLQMMRQKHLKCTWHWHVYCAQNIAEFQSRHPFFCSPCNFSL